MGCKEPNLHISISLVDLVALSLISGQRATELFRRDVKIGFDPIHENEPWIGQVSLELKKPCRFLGGKKCSIYPGSRKPRPLAVDECANFWPGCRPTRALVRCHGLCPWGSTLAGRSLVLSFQNIALLWNIRNRLFENTYSKAFLVSKNPVPFPLGEGQLFNSFRKCLPKRFSSRASPYSVSHFSSSISRTSPEKRWREFLFRRMERRPSLIIG